MMQVIRDLWSWGKNPSIDGSSGGGGYIIHCVRTSYQHHETRFSSLALVHWHRINEINI